MRRCLSPRIYLFALAVWLPTNDLVAGEVDVGRLTDYRLDRWSRRDGLSGGAIKCLAFTPDGYLWVGTHQGLYRFDGKPFRQVEAEIGQEEIWDMAVDQGGRLWIATHTAIYLRENDSIRRFAEINSIQRIAVDASGLLWVATWFGLVRVESDGQQKIYTREDGLPDIRIRPLMATPTGLLMGTPVGMVRFENERFEVLSDNTPEFFTLDPEGGIWSFNYQKGLTHRVGNKSRQFKPEDGLSTIAIFELYSQGMDLWIGSAGGLSRLRDNAIETLGASEGLVGTVCAIIKDDNGNLWAGTSEGLLYRLKAGLFTRWHGKKGMPGNVVGSVYRDNQDQLWVSFDTGVARLNKKEVEAFYPYPDSSPGHGVITLAQAPNGTMFFGTIAKGPKVIKDGRLQPWREEQLIHSVTDLSFGMEGDIWVKSANRLIQYKGNTIREYSVPQHMRIFAVHHDRKGNAWMGTSLGLARLQDGEPAYISDEGLASTSVNFIHEDEDGRFWLLVKGHLNGYWDDRFHPFGPVEGMNELWAVTMTEDHLGNLWLTTNSGLFRVRKKDLLERADGDLSKIPSRNLGLDDGLLSEKINSFFPSMAFTSDGQAWLSTLGGLYSFDPAHIDSVPFAPPVRIESLLVDDAPVSLDQPVRVAPGLHRLSFFYTSVDTNRAELLRFRYRLEPVDPSWVEVGSKREITFTGLPPGSYKLHLSASYEGGQWQEKHPTVQFHQRAHFYNTRLFYLLMVAGGLLFFAAAFLFRLRQLQARSRELRRLVDERTEDLRSEKEKTQNLYDQLRVDHHRKTRELEEARDLQLALLPERPPDVAGLSIAVYMKTATEVGGDYYDFHCGDDGALTVAVGDATGHGMKAGLMVTTAKSHFLFHAGLANLVDVAGRISAGLKKLRFKGMFMAMTLLKYKNSEVEILTAGMPSVLIARVSGELEPIQLKGLPLGAMVNFPYQTRSLRLEPGDVALLMSDGLVELFNGQEEMLGEDRVARCFHQVSDQNPETIISALTALEEEWAGGRAPDDDIALVVLKRE